MTESGLTSEEQAFRDEQRRFYAMVGHCILRFQHVEDYLEDMFAAVLGGNRARADAIFASVRGVDRKIQILRAAATDLIGPPWDDLALILSRVKEASDMRGQIAHANPVRYGGTTRIHVRTERGRVVEALSAERIEEARWELRKQAIIFKIEDLHRGYDRIDKLFGDMIAFVELAKQNPPA